MKSDYIAPSIELIEVNVEYGFAVSNMEQIGGEKPEQEW